MSHFAEGEFGIGCWGARRLGVEWRLGAWSDAVGSLRVSRIAAVSSGYGFVEWSVVLHLGCWEEPTVAIVSPDHCTTA